MRRLLFSTFLFVAACGGTTDPKSDPGLDAGSTTSGLTLADACAKFAQARCTGLAAPCVHQQVIMSYPDTATCLAGETSACVDAHARPGRVADPAKLSGCADEAMKAACPALALERDACFPPGTLPHGATCLDDAQCADGFCRTMGFAESGPGPCGVCGEAKAGDACDPIRVVDCLDRKRGLYCDPATNTCAAPKSAPLGAACGEPAVLCESGAHCAGGVCVADSSVEPELVFVGLGESCGGERVCRGGGRCSGGVCVAAQPAYASCTSNKDCSRWHGCKDALCTPLWEYCK